MSVFSSDDWSLPSISSAIRFIYGLSPRLNSALCVFLSFHFIPFRVRMLPSIFPSPSRSPSHPRPPSVSLPVSPLSVDFSTSETKQTQSCVSGLVTLRALLARRSCVFVSPPSSTFSTFLRRLRCLLPALVWPLDPAERQQNKTRVHRGQKLVRLRWVQVQLNPTWRQLMNL